MAAIGYQWKIMGGKRDVDGEGMAVSVDDVSEAVDGALRRRYMPEGPEVLAQVLYAVWGPLRHSLATDGALATRTAGGSWEASAGPLTVRIWAL